MNRDAFVSVPEVDLFGLGLVYFSTGFALLDLIFGAIPVIFFLAMRILSGARWRARVAAWLNGDAWSLAYRDMLEQTLAGLQVAFRGPWSLAALDTCFRLAIVYASLHILARDTWLAQVRDLQTLGVALALLAAGTWLAHTTRQHVVRTRRAVTDDLRSQAVEKGIYLLVTAGALGLATLGNAIGHLALLFLAGWALGAGLAFAVPAAILGILAYPFAGWLGGSLFVFLVMFPCLNAIFDWPSWAASRWLMARLGADAQHPKMATRAGLLGGHIALDALIGILCLYGLASLIVFMTETNQGMLMWDQIFSAGLTDPVSGNGLILTTMLLSTLVPTAVHLFFAVFALAVVRAPGQAWIAGWLREEDGAEEWASRALVSAYLTACAIFALIVLWIGAEGLLEGLGWLWRQAGWAASDTPYPLLSSVYSVASAVAGALAP